MQVRLNCLRRASAQRSPQEEAQQMQSEGVVTDWVNEWVRSQLSFFPLEVCLTLSPQEKKESLLSLSKDMSVVR